MSNSTLIIFAIIVIGGLLLFLRRSKAAQQQRDVKTAGFTARPLMNKSELQLFRIINLWLGEHARGYHVSPQATYGAFLGCKDYAKWRLMSAKRADFVVFDPQGHVRLIIEFDGAGHYGRNRKDADGVRNRDTQKNLAAGAAGIPLVRISSLKDRGAITGALEQVLAPASLTVQPEQTMEAAAS
ncbi:DUF2726 domain-containing protein [Paracoccus sp. T5]|uniref:DUF2726 domain-containing protein n=1 Tax=Paracoccus sp. T5 TaxID=3402161 RepID=UPI003AE43F52